MDDKKKTDGDGQRRENGGNTNKKSDLITSTRLRSKNVDQHHNEE